MKRAYEQRIIEVEHASFTPIVLSASGGLAKGATIFYKRSGTSSDVLVCFPSARWTNHHCEAGLHATADSLHLCGCEQHSVPVWGGWVGWI